MVEGNRVCIDSEKCIACGLCVHRCPTAAIQLELSNNTAYVSKESVFMEPCSVEEQSNYVSQIIALPHLISYSEIPESFSKQYQDTISKKASRTPDLGEILVRNTLINMGIPTNSKAKGNNHNRTEFFGEKGDSIIIGESNCDNSDVLTVSRRILDDVAVMISRYNKGYSKIVPLSVINGFPNKRTDYYEVIYDINNILKISVCTVTFYVLFILNLFGRKLSIDDFKQFEIDNNHLDLAPIVKLFIPDIERIDRDIASSNYRPIK